MHLRALFYQRGFFYVSQLLDLVLYTQRLAASFIFFEIDQTRRKMGSDVFGTFSGIVRRKTTLEIYRVAGVKSVIPSAEDINKMGLGLFLQKNYFLPTFMIPFAILSLPLEGSKNTLISSLGCTEARSLSFKVTRRLAGWPGFL